ncbi:hypothetical protein HGM15179_004032 [Zosterops borbonicus]|uniref:Uncharacterized protein n=1 Tax=Zosterops borbonicus TaxID=364589 RepID=A0A8K1GRG4_9PASS|nr:hypothetical protein HGM15179_004032 [Zosterops borbonicus]
MARSLNKLCKFIQFGSFLMFRFLFSLVFSLEIAHILNKKADLFSVIYVQLEISETGALLPLAQHCQGKQIAKLITDLEIGRLYEFENCKVIKFQTPEVLWRSEDISI